MHPPSIIQPHSLGWGLERRGTTSRASWPNTRYMMDSCSKKREKI
jgi:hypothetical protein